jgi:hypothetical protein
MKFTLDDDDMTAFDMAKVLKSERLGDVLKILDRYDAVALQRLHECVHDVMEHREAQKDAKG